MRSLFGFTLIVGLSVFGCKTAPEPAPKSDHPASPFAAEAPVPSASPTLRDAVTQPAAETSNVPVAYTCPHHPKVMDAEHGECPMCGMKLVPTTSRQMSPLRAAPDAVQN